MPQSSIKVAVVTGASAGIGRATALEFASLGSVVRFDVIVKNHSLHFWLTTHPWFAWPVFAAAVLLSVLVWRYG